MPVNKIKIDFWEKYIYICIGDLYNTHDNTQQIRIILMIM